MERALELAEGLNDRHTMAHVYFQYSLIAERTGNWVQARSYAEKAKAIYEEVRDEANVGKLLNEMGALNHQLGRSDEAIGYLKRLRPPGTWATTRMPPASSTLSPE